jgi:hypothetical protein
MNFFNGLTHSQSGANHLFIISLTRLGNKLNKAMRLVTHQLIEHSKEGSFLGRKQTGTRLDLSVCRGGCNSNSEQRKASSDTG